MKINVMIIDDDGLDRYLATRTLNEFDVFGHVAEVPDGSDAAQIFQSPDFVDKWGSLPPTLILLDINMPKMSGFEFLDYLEQLDENVAAGWSSCVILMLTSSSQFGDRERAKAYDRVKGYIEKPIGIEKIQTILDEHYKRPANELDAPLGSTS